MSLFRKPVTEARRLKAGIRAGQSEGTPASARKERGSDRIERVVAAERLNAWTERLDASAERIGA